MKYLQAISNKKSTLDEFVIQFKTQPVGWGYIDTIIHRSYIELAIESLSDTGFLIRGVSWWEHLEDGNRKARIGMGGPISIYYPGWFSETQDYDEINEDSYSQILQENDISAIRQSNDHVRGRILTKETKRYGDVFLTYQKDQNLTPALWIEVPDEWVNPLTDPVTKGFLPEYEKLRDENKKRNFA